MVCRQDKENRIFVLPDRLQGGDGNCRGRIPPQRFDDDRRCPANGADLLGHQEPVLFGADDDGRGNPFNPWTRNSVF